MITRDLVLRVGYTSASLERPLSIYIYDRNIELSVEVVNYDFRFGGNYENLIGEIGIVEAKTYLRSPRGQVFTYPDVKTTVVDDKVKILISDLMTDEESEIGEYTVQIQVFDKDGASMHIHPFKFYVYDLIARTGDIDFDSGDDPGPYVPESALKDVITSDYLNSMENKLSIVYSDDFYKNIEIPTYNTDSKTTEGAINELKNHYDSMLETYNSMLDGTLDYDAYRKEHGIEVDPSNITYIEVINKNYNEIHRGEYYLYRYVAFPSTCSKYSVRWVSNNTSVATVNSTGKVTGVGTGIALITVYSINNPNVYDQFKIYVL